MFERRRLHTTPNKLVRRAAIAGLGLTGLLLAGCANATISTENAQITTCARSRGPRQRGSIEPISATDARGKLIEETNRDLKVLRTRAKLHNDQINITDKQGLTTLGDTRNSEVTVLDDKDVRLTFIRPDFNTALVHVIYKSKSANGHFQLTPGALVCTVDQQLYQTISTVAIAGYIDATKNIK